MRKMIINQAVSFMSIGILLSPQIISAAEVVSPDSQLKSTQNSQTGETGALLDGTSGVQNTLPNSSQQTENSSPASRESIPWGTMGLNLTLDVDGPLHIPGGNIIISGLSQIRFSLMTAGLSLSSVNKIVI